MAGPMGVQAARLALETAALMDEGRTTGRTPVTPCEDRMTLSLNNALFPRNTGPTHPTPSTRATLTAAAFGTAAMPAAPFGGPTSFSTLLEKAQQQLDDHAAQRKQAEDGAAGLVANALILPILKQLRRSSFGENTVFSGGNGEKMFGPQFDMQLADRIAHSPNLGIKNVLADRLMKKAPQAAATKITKGLDVHG
jgi:hypothetical protein